MALRNAVQRIHSGGDPINGKNGSDGCPYYPICVVPDEIFEMGGRWRTLMTDDCPSSGGMYDPFLPFIAVLFKRFDDDRAACNARISVRFLDRGMLRRPGKISVGGNTIVPPLRGRTAQ